MKYPPFSLDFASHNFWIIRIIKSDLKATKLKNEEKLE